LGIALIILSVISSSLIGGPAEVVSTNESELTDEANQVVIPQNQAPMLNEAAQEGQQQPQQNSALPKGDEELPSGDEESE
jgi:hypothetical protein